MHKSLTLLRVAILSIILLPYSGMAQWNVTGRVTSRADLKPVANASVFLSNATIGTTTADDGTFTLLNVKPGKYDLVVSDIAFKNYNQAVIIGDKNVALPDIVIAPQTRQLKEVAITFRADPNRERYFNWFKEEFLGTSDLAKDCKILNSNVLDFNYSEADSTLTASSYDFLEIEDDALGYKIKVTIYQLGQR
jgi:hypothetical protein